MRLKRSWTPCWWVGGGPPVWFAMKTRGRGVCALEAQLDHLLVGCWWLPVWFVLGKRGTGAVRSRCSWTTAR